MSEVILEHISKIYEPEKKGQPHTKTLDDISLTVADKEFLVIVGPSGCGKSTLLRMIAGLEEITSGNLIIDGVLANDKDPRDRDLAMVFQNYALYPHMSVFDNMAFGLKLKGVSKKDIRTRVLETAQLLELEDHLDRKPKSLSGGQRQRVAIGRAIIRRPKVFLFDEPLSNLDAKLRTQMRIELQKLHRDINATMIYVTHDQVEAMTLGTRIAVLQSGKLMQLDTPMQVYNHPANMFVAGFIGSPAMNFITGKFQLGEKLYFQAADGAFNVALDDSFLEIARQNVDCTITLGIRPEHVHVVDNGETHDATLQVSAFENMGNEQMLYFGSEGKHFVLRREAKGAVDFGESKSIFFQRNKIHFFNTETGEVLK